MAPHTQCIPCMVFCPTENLHLSQLICHLHTEGKISMHFAFVPPEQSKMVTQLKSSRPSPYGRSCVQLQHWIHRLHRCMCVMCCLLMSCMVQCECWMHMSSQLLCSLIPCTPDSVPPLPGWTPSPPPQSFAPRWLFPNLSGVWCVVYTSHTL